MKCIALLYNIRSAFNVGSMFRTADGAGFSEMVLVGYTPEPAALGATGLTRAQRDIAKTALGAEKILPWRRYDQLEGAVRALKQEGFEIVALEQSAQSILFDAYIPQGEKVALLVGTEVTGLTEAELVLVDTVVEIPMRGQKESLNVSVSFGIASYALTGTMKKS